MRTRMDKYHNNEELLERTSKNDSLYEQLYREKQTLSSNVTVLDNIDEIDISKIKAMVNNRETRRKERKYENLVNPIDIDSYKRNNINYDFDEIDDKNYDINQILEKKRSGRNYEESPRVRKISDTNYNILKSLDFEAKEDEEEFKPSKENSSNEVVLDGFICKKPVYRKTPFGREIADVLLAVNRAYNKSDYIPCIAWGRNARFCENMPVGTEVRVVGRVQSRQYEKKYEDGTSEIRIAYEVSVASLEVIDQAEDTETVNENEESKEAM